MTINQIRKALEVRQRHLAKERDKLREVAADANALLEQCDQAYDALEEAIDLLSQNV